MKTVSLAVIASAFAVSGAVSQQSPSHSGMGSSMPMMTMQPNASDSAATKGYKEAMMGMMKTMPAFTGDADVDFMKQMRGHHQAAIDMSEVVVANGKDAEVKKLAREIINAQRKEIAQIDTWLKSKNQ